MQTKKDTIIRKKFAYLKRFYKKNLLLFVFKKKQFPDQKKLV